VLKSSFLKVLEGPKGQAKVAKRAVGGGSRAGFGRFWQVLAGLAGSGGGVRRQNNLVFRPD